MKQTALALLATTILAVTPGAALAQAEEHVIYASVVDNKGKSVAGITAADLVVREDGQAAEILSVVKDEDPIAVALLVDNSVAMRDKVSDLRKAISAFVDSLRPGVQVALLTLAERPTVAVDYTTDHEALLKGVEQIVPLEAATYVLDGIIEASQGLSRRAIARPIVVVVTGTGPDLSSRSSQQVLRPLRESGVAFHAITMTSTSLQNSMSSIGTDGDWTVTGNDGTARSGSMVGSNANTMGRILAGDDQGMNTISGDAGAAGWGTVLSRMTKETGGRYQEVLSMSGLNAQLEQLSDEISNQYRVTFARSSRLIPPKSTQITGKRRGIQVRGMLVK